MSIKGEMGEGSALESALEWLVASCLKRLKP